MIISKHARMPIFTAVDLGSANLSDIEEVLDVQSTKPNRMARRRQETRAKLLLATHELIVEKGIEKTTMSDITEAADLGRRTFYYHFTSKDECIAATAVEVYQRHAMAVLNIVSPADDPALVMATATQSVLSSLLREPITACLVERPRLLGDSLWGAIGPFVHSDMQAGIDIGRFTPPMRPKVLDSMMIWSLVGLIIEAIEVENDLAAVLQEYAQMFLMILGIPVEEAKEIALQASKNLDEARLELKL